MERQEVNLVTLLQVAIHQQTGEWVAPEEAELLLKERITKGE